MRSHITAYTQDTVPGRVDAHIAYQNFRAGHHKASGDEIGGRRDISRNHDLIAMEFTGRLYDCRGSFGGYLGAKEPQHQLRMISGHIRFGYAGGAVCI